MESPAKAKTIKKYLGPDFEVLASYGHVRDLVPKEGAVDPAHHFAMKYQIVERNQKHIDAMIEASKETLQPVDTTLAATPSVVKDNNVATQVAAHPAPVQAASIGIDDFGKLDLRIGTVLACEFVEGSDKLLRFELDAGDLGKRQIFSAIRASYGEPGMLVGRNVVFIANLAPRKMRFGVSEGMILSAGFDGSDLHLLDVDSGAQPGMPVK